MPSYSQVGTAEFSLPSVQHLLSVGIPWGWSSTANRAHHTNSIMQPQWLFFNDIKLVLAPWISWRVVAWAGRASWGRP